MMLRIMIIFVLGLIIIPYIQSQTDVSIGDGVSTGQTEVTTNPTEGTTNPTEVTSVAAVEAESTDSSTNPESSSTTTPVQSSPQVLSNPPVPTTSTPAQTDTTSATSETNTAITESTTIITGSNTAIMGSTTAITGSTTAITGSTTAITASTTSKPFGPLFTCDFTTACFADGQLLVTNGSEFNPTEISEPPPAPSSDVTSITTLTSNNQICNLPFYPKLENGTNTADYDIWFCANNQCPTTSSESATCASGSYGLISLDPSETTKTIIDSIPSNAVTRDSVGDQCLRFYYYFTVYDGADWGQQIQVWIRPDNQTVNEFPIGNLTVADMKENKWNSQNITFNSTFVNYTLAFRFEINDANRTIDPALNETIYFALDNIELYDYNCSYVKEQESITTIATSPTATIITTAQTDGAVVPPPANSNLGLILGLSLGIGIPVLLIAAGGGFLYFKKYRNYDKSINFDIPMSSTGGRSGSNISRNSNMF